MTTDTAAATSSAPTPDTPTASAPTRSAPNPGAEADTRTTSAAPADASPEAHELARRVGDEMFADDRASRALGMAIEHIAPGRATLTMRVRDDMLNGFAICHGGFITTLADSAFAFACNSRDLLTVAAGITVDFMAPARAGELLTAHAQEVSLAGRTGVYDVRVTGEGGRLVAIMRGRSYRTRNRVLKPKELSR